MTIRRIVQSVFAALAIAALVASSLIVTAAMRRRQLVAAEQTRFTSFQLADELRHSSDELTRFARTYVNTGDPKYETYYHDVLAIRQGTKPRPLHYERIYWDLAVDSAGPVRPPGAAVPLRQLMRDAGFTSSELALLSEAESRSNQLVTIEETAMHAVRGEYRDSAGNFTRRGTPNQALAVRLVNDSAYHHQKALIMRPIDDFLGAVDARSEADLEHFRQSTVFSFVLIESVLGAFLLIVFLAYPLLSNRILTPVSALQRHTRQVAADLDRLAAVTKQIASGDFHQSYSVATPPLGSTRPDEIGELSRLHDSMITELQETGIAVASMTSDLSRAHETSKQRFFAIFQESPVALVVSEETGKILEVNRAYLELVEATSADEIIGKTASDLDFWSPEDRRTKLVEPLLKFGRIEGAEVSFRSLKGQVRSHQIWATFYEADGARYILSSLVDVTARKQAEAERMQAERQYRELVDGVRDVVFSLTADGKIVTLNPAFERMTGLAPSDWIGKDFIAVFHPDDRGRAFEELQQSIAGDPPNGPPLRILAANGHRYGEIQTAARYHDGRVVSVLGIGRDVSERVALEDQLRQSQKMEAMGSLAGGIAHDFNNLLTVIIGFGQFAQDSTASNKALNDDITEMVNAAERASEMTRQLLAFSRKQVRELRDLNVSKVLGGVEKMLRRMIGDHVILKTEQAEDLGIIRGDAGQLEQIVANLAVNARDAMPNGGTVTMSTANVVIDEEFAAAHAGARAGAFVRLRVTDTGTGMTPEIRARIFEPFFTAKEVGKGTGLGLSTVFGIVQQSQGFVVVDSEVNKGTTFDIHFPRVEARQPSASGAVKIRPTGDGTETVLIAEDNPSLRSLCVRALSDRGYTVLTAANGDEAMELAGRHTGTIDLLITDVVMPGMSGRALAAGLERTRPGIRVLYVSGYSDEMLGQQGALDPAITLLAKPFTPDTLALKVRSVLDRSAVQA